jgi:hypothetical protein
MSEQIETPRPTRIGGPGTLRILVVGAASIALAISAAVALASSAPPAGTGSNASAVGPGPADADGFIGLAAALGQDGGGAPGDPSAPGPRGGGPGFHQITIAAKDGSTLSLKTDDGWTRQIAVASDTKITRAGATIGLGDLKVGDVIAFRQTRNTDGSFKIDEIRVIVPQVAGEVTAVSSSSLTLKLRDGSSKTITLNGNTKYFIGPRAAAQADVKVGANVVVAGTISGDAFTALTVTVRPQVATGEVTAKTADSITLKGRDGSTTTVKVDANTQYRIIGKDNATLADVTVGMQIAAQGIRNSDNTFSAISVGGGDRPAPRGPGRGFQRFDGLRGPGFGGPGGPLGPGQPGAGATPGPTSNTNAS